MAASVAFDVTLQSARSVWRQSVPPLDTNYYITGCNLHGACGGKDADVIPTEDEEQVAICTERVEAKSIYFKIRKEKKRCNLHGACGGKDQNHMARLARRSCNLHGACGGKVPAFCTLHGLQVVAICTGRVEAKISHFTPVSFKAVAICAERVEDLASSPEKNPRKFMQTYCIFIHLGV